MSLRFEKPLLSAWPQPKVVFAAARVATFTKEMVKAPAGQKKKSVNRRKYEGLCEVEVNQVGSSSAAD